MRSIGRENEPAERYVGSGGGKRHQMRPPASLLALADFSMECWHFITFHSMAFSGWFFLAGNVSGWFGEGSCDQSWSLAHEDLFQKEERDGRDSICRASELMERDLCLPGGKGGTSPDGGSRERGCAISWSEGAIGAAVHPKAPCSPRIAHPEEGESQQTGCCSWTTDSNRTTGRALATDVPRPGPGQVRLGDLPRVSDGLRPWTAQR